MGVLRLPEELLPDVPEVADLDADEPPEDVPDDFADCVPRAAACDDEAAAPGRLKAIPPAAMRLAAVTLTAAARIRAPPRSRAATCPDRYCCRLLMPASLLPPARDVLSVTSAQPMNHGLSGRLWTGLWTVL